ncbi:MAG: adenylate kinase [bacterium]|nr:adenylate kinase [bacterium]
MAGGRSSVGAPKGQRRIVFLGPPNSGKGTQATLLAQSVGIPAISTGEMLRAAVTAGSELGRRVQGVMARGELVQDELMAEVVRDRLSQTDAAEGFLLDGYPRTAAQAATLEEIVGERYTELDDVVLIDAPEDVLVARALGRGREDDREEVVRERLRVYRQKTAPLVDFYDVKGLLRRIDGDQPIEQVAQQVRASLGVRAV